MSTPLEHDYIALAETSSMERSSDKKSSSSVQSIEDNTRKTTNNTSLNLKETELRLGLPGSHSPDRKVCLFGKDLVTNDKSNGFGVSPLKNLAFKGADLESQNNSQLARPSIPANDHASAPVVGWPPVRSYRKSTIGSNLAKNNDDAGCLYVKVSMDGAPYLRKVDLKTYKNYMELSSALEKFFSCFTTSEYVVTYEDKDGDWMLVGDVPWQMFTNSCRRLRIMKGSEAVGSLDPRAMEKCRNKI